MMWPSVVDAAIVRPAAAAVADSAAIDGLVSELNALHRR